ncbi:NHLP bacteriocin export ABC transporter permease/ATPase subunit [Nostoc sp. FACHB-152]|uniref:NHLP bacteriocin export ABC transporter permease/ATPase subunit n=1 Tax=unclassified Nostoc TaxID=2593658 RepID=UPI0016855895|nr:MULTISPECIES: NHLP bacteriocin export ABC transporter permease/ATPase subunit [unclassified Nostoc]MBD2449027.1 NHLP bacteriocin export ABC transporter permease/ATPase subunit [Nostoc sp. FACHB-152]MBD2469758.1 NHLP bacteriocin export ABC transporter permease/ATPase subunit [Nostoc sp. FACHB-145]
MTYTKMNYSPNLYNLKANELILLNDPQTLWVVQSGTLAVFATKIKDGSPAERRHYLFNVSPDAALFGAVSGEWSFVAVALENTILSGLPMGDFVAQINSNNPQQAIALVEAWIHNLSQTIIAQEIVLTTPLNIVQINTNGNFSLGDGETLQVSQKSIFWLKLQQGNARWMGVEHLQLDFKSPAFPVTSGLWLEAENLVTGQLLTTAELNYIDNLSASLTNLHTYFLSYLSLVFAQEAEANRRRFEERKQLNRQVAQGALSQLAAVLEPEIETGFFQVGAPLLVALGAVARVQGIQLCYPTGEDITHLKDPVEAIARSSQIRTRRVQLTHGWWRKDQGPLLGYVDSEQHPVAILPTENQGYVLFDPFTQTRTPVNQAVAKTLLPSAYILYKPLPNMAHSAIKLWQFAINGYQKDIAGIFGLGMLGTLLGMIAPQATAILVNHAIPDSDRTLLWQIGSILVAVAFGQLAFQIVQSFMTLRVESVTDAMLQPALWDRLLRLSPKFFRQYTTGDLVNRVMSVRHIHQKLSDTTQRALLSGVFALLNLVLMFVYSPKLALVAAGLAILAAIVTVVASVFLVKKSQKQQQLDGELQGLVVQIINGVAKLRVAMAEERAFAAWSKKYTQQVRLKTSVQLINDRISVFNEALPVFSSILIFATSTLFLKTQLSTGVFLAFNSALVIFMKGVIDLSNTVTGIWSIVPMWQRMQPILRSPLEFDSIKENPGQLVGHISLENVSFRYTENAPLILDNVSLRAEPGEFIAIVGPSGSGKSTIFRLLLGFESPLSGKVYYDSQDLAGLDVQTLRRKLGVVLQNGRIGSGSIFENITAGAIVSRDEAWEAAQMAGLADDIRQMPMQMHTVISEGGSNLSGGQRQRLLIARSLVSQPKIILMDEATSALDNHTQAIVTESLDRLNATRIVIAHRLSTIRNADRIYVMDAGRIVQVGNFSELIGQEGLFARLVARQLE